jgi:S1-C subfamily serine protease
VGSPAEAAGIRPGDLLTHFNDVPLEGFETLRKAELSWMAGEVCELRLLREGREWVVNCALR